MAMALEDEAAPGPERTLAAVQVLGRAASAVHAAPSLDAKVEWVVDAARRLTDAAFVVYVAAPRDGGGLRAVSSVEPVDLASFAGLAAARMFSAVGGPAAVVRLADVRHERRYRSLRDRVVGSAVASYLAVPVSGADGDLHGGLFLGHPAPDRFGSADESAVAALASHLGVAIDNLAVVTHLEEVEATQREAVHQLQEAVRPPLPTVEGTELGVHYLPADPSAPTGGDLYDCLRLPDGTLHLCVVDVVGKGVAATKDAVSVTHALRLLAIDGCQMDRIVARADALVTVQRPELVATVVVARYRPDDGVVLLAGGGHPPALLVSPVRGVRQVPAAGIPIGWPGAGSHELVSVTLERSDALVLYTDGLIEATKDIEVGLHHLELAAAETARYPAGPLARALVDRALSGAMRRDDSLALVLRRRTPPATSVAPGRLGPLEYRFSPSLATVPLARHLFADWLELLRVDDTERADLLLVASELCANAVRHASGAPGALTLRAWADRDAVVVEVEDDGGGFDWEPGHADDERPDPDLEQGRGLYLAEALTDGVEVVHDEGRTTVRAVKRALLPG